MFPTMNRMLSVTVMLTLAISASPYAAAVLEVGECEPGPIVPWTMCMTQEVTSQVFYVAGEGVYLVNYVCDEIVLGRPCLRPAAIEIDSQIDLLA